MTDERQVWINGRMMPESQGSISFRDLGLVYGEAVFDTSRTFGGRIFRLSDHIDRLFESLRYVRIDPGLSKSDLAAATEDLVRRNLKVLRPGEDYWVTQRVTAGRRALDGEPGVAIGATVMIECTPLPLRARAVYFRDGIDAVVSARPKIAPAALSPRAKTTNYLNMMLAQTEAAARRPGAWAIMMDVNGNLAEGAGNNLFIVSKGKVVTPSDAFVLPGVSRQVVLELCASSGIPVEIGEVDLHRAMTADEAFFTSTSLCACPVRSLNGVPYAAGAPGPVTRSIMDLFAAEVRFDYVGQYLAFLSEGPASTGL